MSDALGYLGIARKAGAIEAGENNSGAAVRGGKAKLLVLASDASDNAVRRAENFVYGRGTPLLKLPYTKDEIAATLGTGECAMVAFTDIGLASSFVTALAAKDTSFEGLAAELQSKRDRALARKKEAKAHTVNKKLGKAASAKALGKRRNNK